MDLEAELRSLHSAGRHDDAADRLLRGYGPEIYGYLVNTLGDSELADDAFSVFAEGAWKSVSTWRGESSWRTWAYSVARHAAFKLRRGIDRRRRREVAGASSHALRVAAEVRSSTAAFRRTDVKDRLRTLRDALEPEERELLVLRVDRGLEWLDIARVLSDPDSDTAAIAKRAAALRKKFERTKERLRALAEKAGVLERER